MSFSIQNFESFIDPKIDRRGQEYFAHGAILSLEEMEPDRWKAEVQGTYLYQVEIEMNGLVVNRILCSCPYNYGDVCKHAVAVLYLLQSNYLNIDQEVEEYSDSGNTKNKPVNKKNKNGARNNISGQIKEKLNRLSANELRSYLQEILEEDRYFRSKFMSRMVSLDVSQSKTEIRSEVKRILKPAKNRRSIIYWNEAAEYLIGIQELLQNTEKQLNQGKPVPAIITCQSVIEELVPAIQYIDDSGGDLGSLIEWAFTLLEEAISLGLDESTRKAFYSDCLKQFSDKRYDGWDYGRRFLGIAVALARTPEEVDSLEDRLISLINKCKTKPDSDYMAPYHQESYALQLLDLYRVAEKEDKYMVFMKNFRHLPGVMDRLIRHCFQQQDYGKARMHCEEALRDFTSKPGLTVTWLEWLLKVAVAEDNVSEQRRYSEKLLLNTGKMDWYRTLKELYTENEWPKKSNDLLEKIELKNRWTYAGLVPSICVEEQNWKGLFSYVAANPDLSILQHYDSWLIEHFPKELMRIYKKALLDYVASNTGRKYYRSACNILQRMAALGGRPIVNEIVQHLQEKYQNRPALQEELMIASFVVDD